MDTAYVVTPSVTPSAVSLVAPSVAVLSLVLDRAAAEVVACMDLSRIEAVAGVAAMDRIDTDAVAEAAVAVVAARIGASDLAAEIDLSDLAGEVDLSDLASHIDASDVASNLDVADVASEVLDNLSLSDLAEEINLSALADHIDYDNKQHKNNK